MTAPLAISTVWAQEKTPPDQPRPPAAQIAQGILERLEAVGPRHLELEYRLDRQTLGLLRPELKSRGFQVVSLHNYIPTPEGLRASGDAFNLAHLDPDQRALAVRHAQASLELAADMEVGALVVHLGQITAILDKKVTPDAARAGGLTPEMAAHLRQRAALAPRHLDQACFSLERLLGRAEKLGVAIALENRNHAAELPDIAETGHLLARFAGAPIGFWFDTGHANTQALAGLAPLADWPRLYGDRLLGCHLHDAIGPDDHMPPGLGQLDWPALLAMVAHAPRLVLEVRPSHSVREMADAVRLIEGLLPQARAKSRQERQSSL